ncbi:hypothetical protein J6T66_04185 [bacterium]|nr:hypothetical protein [bacterium]
MILEEIDSEALSLFVTNLIKNIVKYNQIQKVYPNIKKKNKRRTIQTGIFINSANQAQTHRIRGLYFCFLLFSDLTS